MSSYKVSPTFNFTLDELTQFRDAKMYNIKATRMILMELGQNLIKLDEEIEKLKPKKEEKK